MDLRQFNFTDPVGLALGLPSIHNGNPIFAVVGAGHHRNAMVGFCPGQTTRSIRAWRRRAKSLLLPLELANPSAENSRPTPGGRYWRKT